ncbi:hypothetical protein HOY80DRAFT_864508, partial [Tuber brumale]
SADKTIPYWYPWQEQSVGLVQLPVWVYTMDDFWDILVAMTAEKELQIINSKRPETLFKSGVSPLKWQPLIVTAFRDAAGCEVGGIEGGVEILPIE